MQDAAVITERPAPADSVRADLSSSLPIAAIVACFVLQGWLVFAQPINWDEFRFLADVHLLARGELDAAVQTFHAHFFQWLLWVPGNEVDQIVAARLTMLALEVGTAAMILRCARSFVSMPAALLTVLTWLTFAYVIRHGASFRFDPPSIFLLMSAVTLLLTAQLRLATTAAIGALIALAALITIKAVFLVPTLLILAWCRVQDANDRRGAWLKLVSGAAVGAIVLAALYLYHQSFVVAPVTAAAGIVSGSFEKTIGQSQLLPQGFFLVRALLLSPLNWAFVFGGIWIAVATLKDADRHGRTRAVMVLSFALPLVSLLFYRNAFPYYYTFMLAPAVVPAALAIERVSERVRPELVAALLLGIGAMHGISAASPVLAAQRATVDAVHAIFPDPVAYIDRCSMIASSRKRGIFMSTWGVEVYRDAGRPIMRDILSTDRPAYVLLNSPILESALAGAGDDHRLLPEDTAALQDNFIPHWGPVWVAGKRLNLSPSADFEVLIPGVYTSESSGPVELDGQRVSPGETITLASGHHIAKGGRGQKLTLRWGSQLFRPTAEPPSSPLFASF